MPWVQVDASSLVQPAMAGQALQGSANALLHRAGGDLNLAQHGIVLIDRLDHCLRTSPSPGDPGLAVQEALMTLMDGVILQNKEEPQNRLDTSRLLFICCGAFPWIQAAVEERLEEGSRIGFQIDEEPESTTHIRDLIQKSDLVTLGLSDELASRFNKVSLLNPLGTSDFVHLLKMQNGVLSQKITFWKAHGIDLKFTEAALEAIAEQAQAMGDGARALNGLIEKILDPIDHQIAELARKGVRKSNMTDPTSRMGAFRKSPKVIPPLLWNRCCSRCGPDFRLKKRSSQTVSFPSNPRSWRCLLPMPGQRWSSWSFHGTTRSYGRTRQDLAGDSSQVCGRRTASAPAVAGSRPTGGRLPLLPLRSNSTKRRGSPVGPEKIEGSQR